MAMEEVEDEPLFCDRAAGIGIGIGIGIGKATIMVTIRVPSETRKSGRQQETREFGTTRRELLALAGWLRAWQVEKAGMESTSDYWKPVYFLLEKEGFDCTLYQASQVKALPGRPKIVRMKACSSVKNEPSRASSSRAVLRRTTPRAISASTLGFRSPAAAARSISRPETPWMSLITDESFRCASSGSFSRRSFCAVRIWVSFLR
jgi:hypothetical protein